MSQELDFSEFRKVFENLEGVKDQIPAIKKEFVEYMSEEMLSKVQANIRGTGKVQSWQEHYAGSGGGYSAVRAKAKTFTEATKKNKNVYAVGYVTNAIENGHKIANPSGSYKYRPRFTMLRVPGRHFYKNTLATIDQEAAKEAEALAQKIARKMEEAMSK